MAATKTVETLAQSRNPFLPVSDDVYGRLY